MNSKFWTVLAAFVVVFGLTLASAPAALADGPNGRGAGDGTGPRISGDFAGQAGAPQRMAQRGAHEFGKALGRGKGEMGRAANGPRGEMSGLMAVAAEELGLTRSELAAALQAGQSIEMIAAEKGIEVQTILDSFVASRSERLAARLAAGQMTQEEVDARLEAMRAQVTARLAETGLTHTPMSGERAGQGDGAGTGTCDGTGRMGQRQGQGQ